MGPPGRRDEGWFTSLYAAEYAHIVRYGLRRLADADASAEQHAGTDSLQPHCRNASDEQVELPLA